MKNVPIRKRVWLFHSHSPPNKAGNCSARLGTLLLCRIFHRPARDAFFLLWRSRDDSLALMPPRWLDEEIKVTRFALSDFWPKSNNIVTGQGAQVRIQSYRLHQYRGFERGAIKPKCSSQNHVSAIALYSRFESLSNHWVDRDQSLQDTTSNVTRTALARFGALRVRTRS